MIKPEELRRNNLVEYDGKIFKVKSISDYIISADRGKGLVDFTYEEINAIELTEEWLFKLGFEDKYLTIDKKISSDFTMTLISDKDGGFHFTPHATLMWGVDLKYVHQLQNLYFSLCGLELTLK